MKDRLNHIAVCVCTFKRPALLRRLLAALRRLDTGGLFTYSVVIVDNDIMETAREIVTEFGAISSVSIKYCVEPQANIAMARNRAVENAFGDFIAFIDDDELPENNWLTGLFVTCQKYAADGALGPVKPFFECDPPIWAVRGRFFERPTHPTGYKLRWQETRTGNVLFRARILDGEWKAFRQEFDTINEDTDFFRRMMQKGHVFIWCNEACVRELVPPSRCTRSYLLKRALLRGSNFSEGAARRSRGLLESAVAAPSYVLFLPVFLILDHDLFLNYLIRLFDHLSRIASFLGWRMQKKRPA